MYTIALSHRTLTVHATLRINNISYTLSIYLFYVYVYIKSHFVQLYYSFIVVLPRSFTSNAQTYVVK